MTTNLEIASIAQKIQDKSSDNVSVTLTFGLNESIGLNWEIHVAVFDQAKTKIIENFLVSNISDESEKNRMMIFAEHGYETICNKVVIIK